MTSTEAIESAIDYLQTYVRPFAEEMDHNSAALANAFRGLAERKLLGLKCPKEYGGLEVTEPEFRRFQQEMARASGALAFLVTQHQSAVGMIAKSDNKALKDEYLPHMSDGTKLVGIGFSQLRRSGPPITLAQKEGQGFRLSGHVPWVTGWTFYPEFLVGATLPDGSCIFGVVPLPLSNTNEIEVSAPMRLGTMQAANTVSLDFHGYYVPAEKMLMHKTSEWIVRNDLINIALQGHFAIGCAQAGVDIIAKAAEQKKHPAITRAFEALSKELADLRSATEASAREVDELSTDARLAVRAWAIDLAVRAAHAALTATGGSGISQKSPVQRVLREAMVYTVSAQTPPIMEATLGRLIRED